MLIITLLVAFVSIKNSVVRRSSLKTAIPMTNDQSNEEPTKSALPQWDESIVLEYEARVEPFTGLFVEDLLGPIFAAEKKKQLNTGNYETPFLLDVGCGAGIGSILAAQNGFQVTATDVSKGMVDRTRQRALEKGLESSIECLVADGQNLSASLALSSSDKFDYAIAAFSLIFFPDPAKGLSEVFQCLSENGGKVLLSAWGNAEETPAFQIFSDAFQAVKHDSRKPTRITGSPSVLQALLETAGFQDIQVVGPVSHNVHVASPQAYFDRFALTSPKIKGDLEQLDPNERQAVKAKVLELSEERGGGHPDASISIPSMAYLAYGTKRIPCWTGPKNKHSLIILI